MTQMNLSPEQVASLESRLAALEALPPALARGHLHGLTIAPAAAAPLSSVTVSVGLCRDRADTVNLQLTTPITKSLNGTWVAGSTANGLDTGTKAPSVGYHVYLIFNPTTSAYDVVFSLSALNPALPSGFTKYRRIGAVMMNSGSEIRPFIQHLNHFYYKPAGRLLDLSAVSNAGPSSYLRQLGVPQGKKFYTKMWMLTSGAAAVHQSGVFDPDHGAPTMSNPTDWGQLRRMNGTGNNAQSADIWQWTDTNGQVYTASTDVTDTLTLMVLGWIDDFSQLD